MSGTTLQQAVQPDASGQSAPLAYPWPRQPGCEETPVWTGRGFRIGDTLHHVLSYGVRHSNWSDELTTFHEENAGDNHFIDSASRRHALRQLKRFVRVRHPVILEVGCSSGFLLRDLVAAYPQAVVIGSDYVRGPLEALAGRTPDLPLLQFDLVHCPLPSESLDAVVLLNVLEHIEDHATAVHQLYRVLKPGGVAVIEVPAGPHLYDVYDLVLTHWRRYTLGELRKLTEQAGFRTVYASHLGFFLYPAFAWTKRAGRRLLAAPAEVQKTWVAERIAGTGSNPLLHGLMRAEMALGSVVRYARGIRCLLTAAKPG
jgi:SAM-dependent methyltransferase